MPAAAFLDELDTCFQCRNVGSDVGAVVSHCAHFSPWLNRPNLRKLSGGVGANGRSGNDLSDAFISIDLLGLWKWKARR